MSDVVPADLRAAAALGGEMGRRLMSFDWAGHPLGDPASWSPAVRATVAVALASRFPTVLWLGKRLHLVYNDAYIPVLGDKHPAALGGAGAEVWWDIWDVIGPMLASVVRTGVATWSDDLMLMLVNDGRRQQRYFTFTYSPIIGALGQSEGVFCVVTETTERVLGERRLQALSALSAALIDAQSADAALSAAAGVFTTHDADLPFAAIYLAGGPEREARLHRATPGVAGLLPSTLAQLLGAPGTGEDGARVVGGLPSLLPGLASRFGDLCPEQALVLALGEVTDGAPAGALVLGLNPWRELDELYRGFCGLLADQVSAALASARAYESERRRAEALAELDRAKTVFLANVSHEFRTPLTLMLGPLEDMIAAAPLEDGLTGRLEMMRRNGRRMLRLVNSLLDFSRIEAGRTRPQLAAADVGALTAGLAASFADVCRLAGIELVLDCQAAWAEVDPEMWETVVLNLVSNAFKYTFAGTITVRVGPGRGGGVEMTVADTGIGIAADDLPHLFERFYRVQNAAGRSAEGTGIGLALVRSLIEMHDGTIEVASSPGAGTTMSVRLPGARGQVQSAGHRPPPSAAGGPGNPYVDEAMQWLGADPGENAGTGTAGSPRPLILVADDNADMRRHLAGVLSRRWDVMAAADGSQALEAARRRRPDLLVTDVMMPVADGFELVAAIRADPDLAALPVIMLSARAGVEAAGEGLAGGADSYLVKPFSSADLVNQVEARLKAAERDRAAAPHDERLRQRELALAGLGTALGAARSLGQALAALLAAPLCSPPATAAGIGLLDETRGRLRLTYGGEMPGEAADRYHLVEVDAPVPMAEVVREDRPMVAPDTGRPDRRYQKVAADFAPNVRAAVIMPLHADDGSVLGAMGLTWPRPREFSPADLEVLDRAAVMMARTAARISVAEREHQIAMSLQERLLDLGVGSTAAVVQALYQSAGEQMRVGGDWYTATPVDDHRVGVSVGDVVGHGLPAATVMSQLRSALGAAALATAEPAAVLDLLDRYARRLPEATFATVAYAIIDVSAGTVDYMCAGHPYPLLITADGGVRYLRDGRRSPVDAKSLSTPPSAGHCAFPPGSLLLLYTDGLIERRNESLDAGFARLAAAAARCARLPAGAVCSVLLEAMAGEDGYADDVALIAVRPAGTTSTSHVDALRADFGELAPARDRLRAWLDGLQVSPAAAYNILAAAGEAVSNAIEHGSELDGRRTVGIEAFAGDDAISVTVSDSGRWSKDSTATSRAANRGRGLTLIHGLSDDVRTVRTALGTRVTMTHRPGVPARLPRSA